MIERIDAGPRMSEACIHGGIAYLAGQVPETAGADIETQTREVLEAIDALLAQAGSDKSRQSISSATGRPLPRGRGAIVGLAFSQRRLRA